MHMRLYSHDLQFLNLGDRFCNLKKVWWDTVGIGGYALSNTLRFVQWSRYEKIIARCVFSKDSFGRSKTMRKCWVSDNYLDWTWPWC